MSRKRALSEISSEYDADDKPNLDVSFQSGFEAESIYESGSAKNPGVPLRKGKWTPDEEIYANRIIAHFNRGLLNIAPGSTLRCLLSEKLNCDPMRITKKFAGASCIGKQVFQPCDQTSPDSIDEMKRAEEELSRLEQTFIERLAYKGTPVSTQTSTSSPITSKVEARSFKMDDEGDNMDREVNSKKKTRIRQERGMSRRFVSAPDLSGLVTISPRDGRKGSAASSSDGLQPVSSESSVSGLRGLQRSHTVVNLEDYSEDDHAAGYLLLQFFKQMQQDLPGKTPLSPTKPIKSEENTGNATKPVSLKRTVEDDIAANQMISWSSSLALNAQAEAEASEKNTKKNLSIINPANFKATNSSNNNDYGEVRPEKEEVYSPPSF